jgi:hypothetical protein
MDKPAALTGISLLSCRRGIEPAEAGHRSDAAGGRSRSAP